MSLVHGGSVVVRGRELQMVQAQSDKPNIMFQSRTPILLYKVALSNCIAFPFVHQKTLTSYL
jgi:hypothetical protein